MNPAFTATADAAEKALLQRAADWPEYSSLADLTADVLERLTREQGVDFATALLFDRLRKSPANARFIERIDALREFPRPPVSGVDATVVIVPGALYRERPDLGSDGRLVREVAESFNLRTDFIPLVSFGSVTHNARLIREWFMNHSPENVVLVSLSKGGADLRLALTAPDAPAVFRKVAAWVNVCGPLNGSRLANWILSSRARTWFMRWKFRLQGRDFHFVTDLRQGRGTLLDLPARPAPAMKLVSVMGFPLRRHISSRYSRFCHRTLSAHGPNDGTTSLSDLQDWPGEIYPAWGMDHYFRPEQVAQRLIAAVLQFVLDEIPAALTERRVLASTR
jgi:hypothetical protein